MAAVLKYTSGHRRKCLEHFFIYIGRNLSQPIGLGNRIVSPLGSNQLWTTHESERVHSCQVGLWVYSANAGGQAGHRPLKVVREKESAEVLWQREKKAIERTWETECGVYTLCTQSRGRRIKKVSPYFHAIVGEARSGKRGFQTSFSCPLCTARISLSF